MCRNITSHWQPLFSKKMAAAASFSYKIGGGGLIFLQNNFRKINIQILPTVVKFG